MCSQNKDGKKCKRNTDISDDEEPEQYVSILQDLAKAVKHSPPKKDPLEMWGDVLITNLRVNPVRDDTQSTLQH